MTRKQSKCLKTVDWPIDDRERWAAATSGKRSLRAKTQAAEWVEETRNNSARAWGTYLVFLAAKGNLDAAQAMEQRVNPEWVHAFGEDQVVANSLSTAAMRINAMLNFLRATAPNTDIEWLRILNRHFQQDCRDQGSDHPEPPRPSELLSVGIDLMRDADDRMRIDALTAAQDYRDGLLIALMALRSIRRRPWSELDLGKNLFEADDEYTLRLFKANSKTGDQYRAPVPKCLVPYLRKYLTIYRPILVEAYRPRSSLTTNAVFVSPKTGRMSGTVIHRQVTRWTKHYLGRAVPPQEFRRATATEASRIDPLLAYTAAAINGHKGLRVGQQYYDMASNRAGLRQYGEILDAAGAYEEGDEPAPKGTIY
jgi:integrase/recombinase XerD